MALMKFRKGNRLNKELVVVVVCLFDRGSCGPG